jgi:co-chaperonin GroES (HSP10)
MKSNIGRPIGNLRPTGNKILLKLDPRPAQTGLLIVPEAYQERQLTGTVEAWGERIHAPVLAYLRKGMHVRVRNDICGYETWVGDVEYRLIQDGDLLYEVLAERESA